MTTVTRTSKVWVNDAEKEIFAMEEAGWRVRQITAVQYDLFVVFERDKD